MSMFFPRQSLEFKLEEPAAFRKLTLSLVEMALITGIVVRLCRALVLTHGSTSWLYLGTTFGLIAIFMLGMTTAHLANYPLHQWLWRAPSFAGLAVLAEMGTSAFLIWAGREADGAVRAGWGDWPAMAANALLLRGVAISLWALALAGAVTLVRRMMLGDVQLEEEPGG
jgi:hypothetical protein